MNGPASVNPIDALTEQPTLAERSISIDLGLTAHYRHDLPGSIQTEHGFSHHLLTFFLSRNEQQIIHQASKKLFDGPMEAEDFYLCPAHSISSTQWRSRDQTFHFSIAPEFLYKLAEESESFQPGGVELQTTFKARDPMLSHLVQLFLHEMDSSASSEQESGGQGDRLLQESLSTMFGLHLLRRYCNVVPLPEDVSAGLSLTQCKQVFDYIQAHLAEKLSLQEMADQVGMSRSYFAMQFKQSQGVSPHQFVNQQRIAEAKRLLSKNQPLGAIALDCGFSSQSHFSRRFKQQVGLSPSAYRRAL